jgi:aspartate/methionine/tyrosine aminotransferase
MVPRFPVFELASRAAVAAENGTTLIPMTGVPVLPMPPHVREAALIATGQVFTRQSRGHASLRAAIAADLAASQQLRVDPETELLVTHGAQHGMSVVLRALLSPSDEVVVPAPTYLFDGMLRMAGARPVYVQCRDETGWQLDVDAIAAAVTPATKAILLCNPNNPTGNVPRRPCLEQILALAARHGLYVLSDESYARYVYLDAGYTPQMALRCVHPQLVTVTSLSKNYAFTSWRIGYVHAPRPLTDKILRALEWDAINVGDVPQAAAAAAITGPQWWILSALSAYRGRRDLLVRLVRAAGLSVVPPEAGVFMSVDFTPWDLEGRDLEDALLRAGLAALCLDEFHGPATHARLLFGGAEDDLVATGRALAQSAQP